MQCMLSMNCSCWVCITFVFLQVRDQHLGIAIEAHPDVTSHVFIDERSSAFFALGLAKALQKPCCYCDHIWNGYGKCLSLLLLKPLYHTFH